MVADMRVRSLPILPLLLDPAPLLLLPCIAALSGALGVELLLLTSPMLLSLEGAIELLLALVVDDVVVDLLGGARKVRRRLHCRLTQCAKAPALIMVLVLSGVVRIQVMPLPTVLLQVLRLLMVPLPMLLLDPLLELVPLARVVDFLLVKLLAVCRALRLRPVMLVVLLVLKVALLLLLVHLLEKLSVAASVVMIRLVEQLRLLLLLLTVPLTSKVSVIDVPPLRILVLSIAIVGHGLLEGVGVLGPAAVVLGLREVLQSAMPDAVGEVRGQHGVGVEVRGRLAQVPLVVSVRPNVVGPASSLDALHPLLNPRIPFFSCLGVLILNDRDARDGTCVTGGSVSAGDLAMVLIPSRSRGTASRLRKVARRGRRLGSLVKAAVVVKGGGVCQHSSEV